MVEKTLTAANSTFGLAVTSLYPVPQVLDQFSADAPFSTDDLVIAETVMSLDGKLLGGFVPNPVSQTIILQPTSNGVPMIINWLQASVTNRALYRAEATIIIPELGAKYVLSRGILISGKSIPDVRKITQPLSFKIQWEKIVYMGV